MRYLVAVFVVIAMFLEACSSSKKPMSSKNRPRYTPKTLENSCAIMDAHPTWRRAFIQTYKKYGVPPHVVMAIIYQESRYKYNALSKSMAYGYPQAKKATWDWYIDKTGYEDADREHLPDAVDFIGWYLTENTKRTGVSKWDTEQQYLAYHDGTGGYLRGTHLKKGWLLEVAEKVGRHAEVYREQLTNCFSYPKF